jgi:hypothetical protein
MRRAFYAGIKTRTTGSDLLELWSGELARPRLGRHKLMGPSGGR